MDWWYVAAMIIDSLDRATPQWVVAPARAGECPPYPLGGAQKRASGRRVA